MKYHVSEYYLATGMEGIPYERDYGIIEACSEEEAMEQANKTRTSFNQIKYDTDEEYRSDLCFAMHAKRLN